MRKKYDYTFKQLIKMLNERLDYPFLLEYSKYHCYYLTNLNNHKIEMFESREHLENFIFSLDFRLDENII